MKKIKFIIIVIFLFFNIISASEISTATYLLINSYPVNSAKGESTGVSFTGITSAGLNPASIASVENVEFAAMYNRYPVNINGQKLSIAKNFKFGVVGMEINYIDFGFIDEIKSDIYGNPTPTGNNLKSSVLFSSLIFSRNIKNFNFGIASKFVFENLAQSDNFIFCMDVGFVYKDMIIENLNVGVSLLNITTQIDGFYTPVNLKAAINYSVYNNFLIVSSAINYLVKEDYVSFSAGIDFKLFDILILRGGINNNYENINFTGGFGFTIEDVNFDYSIETIVFSEPVHKFSLNVSFGKTKNEKETNIESGDSFKSYMESGNYYYDSKQYRNAIKYFEYINLLYWRDIEKMSDKEKSAFFQKLGICYYNIKDSKRALQYFERAYYFDRNNEILKYWIKLLK